MIYCTHCGLSQRGLGAACCKYDAEPSMDHIEAEKLLVSTGWYQRGNGAWSHERDNHKHHSFDEAVIMTIKPPTGG